MDEYASAIDSQNIAMAWLFLLELVVFDILKDLKLKDAFHSGWSEYSNTQTCLSSEKLALVWCVHAGKREFC